MKTWITGSLLAIFLVFMVTGSPLAGTRDDCISKCKEAASYVKNQGIEAAIKAIGDKNGPFVWNDGVSYVFLMDMAAKMLAHPIKPELTKPDTLIESKDVEGKAFFVDIVNAARKGKGWTKYTWPVPGMDINKPKHTYVYRVPGTDYFVAAGFYVMEPGVYR